MLNVIFVRSVSYVVDFDRKLDVLIKLAPNAEFHPRRLRMKQKLFPGSKVRVLRWANFFYESTLNPAR